ncbi:hypothetical protein A6P54_12655 [Bacillus sp. MKU004]|nr:hypothetical protein A6P54_12655 [Bacillus sp. MKU004]
MKRKMVNGLVVFLLVFMITGCSSHEKTSKDEGALKELQTQVDELKLENNKLKIQNQQLKKTTEKLTQQLKNAGKRVPPQERPDTNKKTE